MSQAAEQNQITSRQNTPAPQSRKAATQSTKAPRNKTPLVDTVRRARVMVQSPTRIAQARLEVLLSPGLRWADAPDFSGSTPRVVWQGHAGARQSISIDLALQPLPSRPHQLTVRLVETAPNVLGGLLNQAKSKNSAPQVRRIIEERLVTLPAIP
jgi:hypothetical protein